MVAVREINKINIKALGVNHTPFQVKWSVPPMIRYLDVAIIEHEVNLIVKPGLIHYIVFLLDIHHYLYQARTVSYSNLSCWCLLILTASAA